MKKFYFWMAMALTCHSFQPVMAVKRSFAQKVKWLASSSAKHTREVIALLAGAAIAAGATYGVAKRNAKTSQRLSNEKHAAAVQELVHSHTQSLQRQQASFDVEIAMLRQLIPDTISRTVSAASADFDTRTIEIRDMISRMLQEQKGVIEEGVSEFNKAGERDRQAAREEWQSQFNAMKNSVEATLGDHAQKLTRQFDELRQHLQAERAAFEAQQAYLSSEEREARRQQLDEQSRLLTEGLSKGLRLLDQRSNETQKVLIDAVDALRVSSGNNQQMLLEGLNGYAQHAGQFLTTWGNQNYQNQQAWMNSFAQQYAQQLPAPSRSLAIADTPRTSSAVLVRSGMDNATAVGERVAPPANKFPIVAQKTNSTPAPRLMLEDKKAVQSNEPFKPAPHPVMKPKQLTQLGRGSLIGSGLAVREKIAAAA